MLNNNIHDTEGAEKSIYTLTGDIYLLKSRIKKSLC